jgi:single-strand DNA-binding protein
MYYFNKVQLIGNISSDLEMKSLESKTSLLNFSIAVNESWFDKGKDEWKEKAHFFNVVAWGKVAERIFKHEMKGNKIMIEGKLTQESWKDKDGNNRTAVKVTVLDYVKISPNTERGEVKKPETDRREDDKPISNMTDEEVQEITDGIPF